VSVRAPVPIRRSRPAGPRVPAATLRGNAQEARMEKRMKTHWVVAITAVATVAAVLLALNFARPEKKLERSIGHTYAIDDPQFRREMGALLGPAIVGGNAVQALNNGAEIFPAMLADIRAATTTINFETYIYWSGDVGQQFADALAERARAGVQVRVLIDWVGGLKMEDSLVEALEQAGVEVHLYRPLHWYNLGRLNNRTHRKLLVVDGRIGYTGGVGIADVWTGDAQDPEHWRDMHFRVLGPVVTQMQAAFVDNWIKATGTVLSGPAFFPPLEPVGTLDAHLFISSPEGGNESMHLMYLMTIAAARHSIDIHASYFVPDPLVIGAMIEALGRGVRIRVLAPGDHMDANTVKLASKSTWGELLAAGAEFHEYQPTMMHVKSVIVDGTMVSIGSTNFDMRSFSLNDEASMNVYDRDFAALMTAQFERDLGHARPYRHQDWLDRPWRERFAETVLLPIRSQL
jgi:cardiolipin synthase